MQTQTPQQQRAQENALAATQQQVAQQQEALQLKAARDAAEIAHLKQHMAQQQQKIRQLQAERDAAQKQAWQLVRSNAMRARNLAGHKQEGHLVQAVKQQLAQAHDAVAQLNLGHQAMRRGDR